MLAEAGRSKLMKRALFAVAWMAVAGAAPALADYVRITVDVKNATPNVTLPNPQGNQGGVGFAGGAGQIGTPPPVPPGFGGKKGFGFAGGGGFMGVPQNQGNMPPVTTPPPPKDDA